MEKRKLTKEDIDKVRNIEGFPIGTDEDIIALSDAPYYTACPNPFVEDFIRENGTSYDEESDNYHREPFASDVSEGKTDPIYMAHTYHTKVPHKAIQNYIFHYTNPGDIVFDGFCGTGMTAVAAQMCDEDSELSLFEPDNRKKGARYAIVSDLSPIATFIAHNYTNDIDVYDFYNECKSIIERLRNEYLWMYETEHKYGQKGVINYVVWADKFICPNCGQTMNFWDVAVGEDKKIKNPFYCPSCGLALKKSDCKREQETFFDERINEFVTQAKQVPSYMNYIYDGKKYEKKLDKYDYDVLSKVNEEYSTIEVPYDLLPDGDNTAQPKQSHNFTRVNQFYFKRSAIIFSRLFDLAKESKYKDTVCFVITGILTKTGSKLHNIGFKDGKLNLAGAMPNVLYVPSTVAERNIIDLFESKVNDICKVYKNKVVICTALVNDRLFTGFFRHHIAIFHHSCRI